MTVRNPVFPPAEAVGGASCVVAGGVVVCVATVVRRCVGCGDVRSNVGICGTTGVTLAVTCGGGAVAEGACVVVIAGFVGVTTVAGGGAACVVRSDACQTATNTKNKMAPPIRPTIETTKMRLARSCGKSTARSDWVESARCGPRDTFCCGNAGGGVNVGGI